MTHSNLSQHLQPLPCELLVAAAQGNIDLNDMAARELANRGLDGTGKWVGFKEAERLYQEGAERRKGD